MTHHINLQVNQTLDSACNDYFGSLTRQKILKFRSLDKKKIVMKYENKNGDVDDFSHLLIFL